VSDPERDVDERLADWVDGRMSERERERFVAELRVNPQLRRDLEQYERTVGVLRAALRAPTTPTHVADRVLATIASGGAPGTARGAARWPRAWWSFACAAAVLAAVLWIDHWSGRGNVATTAIATHDDPFEPAPHGGGGGVDAPHAPVRDAAEVAGEEKASAAAAARNAQSEPEVVTGREQAPAPAAGARAPVAPESPPPAAPPQAKTLEPGAEARAPEASAAGRKSPPDGERLGAARPSPGAAPAPVEELTKEIGTESSGAERDTGKLDGATRSGTPRPSAAPGAPLPSIAFVELTEVDGNVAQRRGAPSGPATGGPAGPGGTGPGYGAPPPASKDKSATPRGAAPPRSENASSGDDKAGAPRPDAQASTVPVAAAPVDRARSSATDDETPLDDTALRAALDAFVARAVVFEQDPVAARWRSARGELHASPLVGDGTPPDGTFAIGAAPAAQDGASRTWLVEGDRADVAALLTSAGALARTGRFTLRTGESANAAPFAVGITRDERDASRAPQPVDAPTKSAGERAASADGTSGGERVRLLLRVRLRPR
jgi:hypothetical protein